MFGWILGGGSNVDRWRDWMGHGLDGLDGFGRILLVKHRSLARLGWDTDLTDWTDFFVRRKKNV